MKERVDTVEVIAWLNETAFGLRMASRNLERATELIFKVTASHLSDETLKELRLISPDDLRGFGGEE